MNGLFHCFEKPGWVNDQLIGRIDFIFESQVETVIGVPAVGKSTVITIRKFIRKIVDAGDLIGVVIGIVEKITAAHGYLGSPEVGIVDTK